MRVKRVVENIGTRGRIYIHWSKCSTRKLHIYSYLCRISLIYRRRPKDFLKLWLYFDTFKKKTSSELPTVRRQSSWFKIKITYNVIIYRVNIYYIYKNSWFYSYKFYIISESQLFNTFLKFIKPKSLNCKNFFSFGSFLLVLTFVNTSQLKFKKIIIFISNLTFKLL